VPAQFVHLHLHTQYSLLDGANQIDPLIEQVKAFGMPAVAITDHGNMFGAVEFYQKAHAKGVKPIIGCEAYLAPGSRLTREGHLAHNDYYHLILLAANRTGYQNLIKLVSKAYLEGFYYKPRMDKELLQQHHEGLIALSGCLSGEVPYLIGQKDMEGAIRVAGEYREIFGNDCYYLEVQANGLEHQRVANRGLVEIHHKLGIPLAGTNDCHYLKREDARPHDLMLCLQTGKTVNDPNRLRFDTDQLYVKSVEEMVSEFAELPEAVRNTCRIAEQCDLNLRFNQSYLPQYQVPEGHTRESYLEQLTTQGLTERLRERTSQFPADTYAARLREELAVILSMGYAGYFLIVWDIIKFARSRGIPVGPGRGSAAGSLVAYALRITDIDPLVYHLLFERFLNPERVTMPDIDMDFCMDRRGEVINYVIDKYGEDHVCQIITFGTLGAKAAIRDVGRVMEIPYAEVDRVAKLVPPQLNITLEEALAQEPRLREQAEGPAQRRVGQVLQVERGPQRHQLAEVELLVVQRLPERQDVLVPQADLRRPGQRRAVLEDHLAVVRVAAGEGRRLRSRPDQRHVAAQDVQQLRQLVEAAGPQELAGPGDAQVVGRSHLRTAGARSHGAELVDDERHPALSEPHLPEQHRPGAAAAHGERHQREHRQQQQQRGQRDDHVERAPRPAGADAGPARLHGGAGRRSARVSQHAAPSRVRGMQRGGRCPRRSWGEALRGRAGRAAARRRGRAAGT